VPRHTDARTRAVRTAGRLFQEQGYGATGLSQIIAESGAPKGSFYFHFPGGKEQLGVEAIRASGGAIAAALGDLAARSPDPATLIRDYSALQQRMLEESNFRRGCPIATITLEMASSSEPIREAAAEVFDSWVVPLTAALDGHVRQPARAVQLARHVVVAMEGALLVARAQRSTAPLREAAELLIDLIGAESGPPFRSRAAGAEGPQKAHPAHMATEHEVHDDHPHQHGPDCGHVAVQHGDHVDYLHDGHVHRGHDDHWHECSHEGHVVHEDHAHQHGDGCGHESVQHEDHVDYVHDGHRHAAHEGHWDEH
jgi:AcrR family transcriptional regulator